MIGFNEASRETRTARLFIQLAHTTPGALVLAALTLLCQWFNWLNMRQEPRVATKIYAYFRRVLRRNAWWWLSWIAAIATFAALVWCAGIWCGFGAGEHLWHGQYLLAAEKLLASVGWVIISRWLAGYAHRWCDRCWQYDLQIDRLRSRIDMRRRGRRTWNLEAR